MTTTFKLALRDLLRHRGRSVLAILMVALPVTVILTGVIAATTIAFTSHEHATDDSQAIARISPTRSGEPSTQETQTVNEFGDHLKTLTGAQITASREKTAHVRVGSKISQPRIGWYFHDESLTNSITITSGRAPTGPNEALVTPLGLAQGIPATGTADVTLNQSYTPVTIVGTAEAHNEFANQVLLMRADPETTFKIANGGYYDQYYFTIRAENRTQQAAIAQAITDKVDQADLKPRVRVTMLAPVPQGLAVDGAVSHGIVGTGDATAWLISSALALALASFVIGLMVAPAFAISANQQRHTLSLITQNGATKRHLRRIMATQGLLVAAVGCALAALLTCGFISEPVRTIVFHQSGRTTAKPLIPIILLGFILLVVTCSVVLSAMLTSSRVTTAPQKATKPQPPSKFFAAFGALCVLLGLTVMCFFFQHSGFTAYLTVMLLGTVGLTLLVPTTLWLAAALSSKLPTTMRYVSRDIARNTGRTGPVVSAIAGATAFFGILGLATGTSGPQPHYGVATNDDRAITDHTIFHQVVLKPIGYHLNLTDQERAAVAAKHPTAEVISITRLGLPERTKRYDPRVQLINADCYLLTDADGRTHRCPKSSSRYPLNISSASLTDLTKAFSLNEKQQNALAQGAVLAPNLPHITDHMAVNVAASATTPSTAQKVTVVRHAESHYYQYEHVALVTHETAAAWKVPAQTTRLLARSNSLPQLQALYQTAKEVTQTPLDNPFEYSVPQEPDPLAQVLAIFFITLIVVVAILGSALNFRQLRNQNFVLTALGSPARYTRWLAAGQSWWLAATGVTIGAFFSALFVSTYIVSANPSRLAVVHQQHFPWLQLGAIWLVVPLLAAAITALCYRPQLPMKRRAS